MDPAPLGKVNSLVLTPILLSRHCKRSVTELSIDLVTGLIGYAFPAATAIVGNEAVLLPLLSIPSLSVLFLGRRNRVLVPGPSVKSFVAHAVTVASVIWRRHLPTCMTSGMLVPEGASVRVKEPSAPVSAAVMGSPDGVAHLSHVGPPVELAWVMGSTALLGT